MGPYSKEELAEINDLTDETLIWYEGIDKWMPYKYVFNEKTPPPPYLNTQTIKAKSLRKRIKGIGISIAIFSLVVFGVFQYRSFLIEEALNMFKRTGRYKQESLIRANNLGSDYAGALLAFSYFIENDSLQAAKVFNKLTDSSDWRVIALKNEVMNQNEQIDVVKKGIEDAVENGDWFWTHRKAVCIFDNKNGYEFNKAISLQTEKKAADYGCVSAMRVYALKTEDIKERCFYLQKVIDSDYQRKEELGVVYFAMALMSLTSCKNDAKLYFKYATKAAELGSAGGYYLLGEAYSSGIGTSIDYNKSYTNYLKAVELGFGSEYTSYFRGQATYALALCYKYGRGVAVDKSKYKKNLNIAAELGNSDAINEKTIIKKQETIRKSGNGLKTCKCCGSSFNPNYGWGNFSDLGAFRTGSSEELVADTFLRAFGGGSSIEYCSKQCALDCQ